MPTCPPSFAGHPPDGRALRAGLERAQRTIRVGGRAGNSRTCSVGPSTASSHRITTGRCSLGSLASEIIKTDRDVCTECANAFEQWRAIFRDGLERMRSLGLISAEADPTRLAHLLLSAHQGHASCPGRPRHRPAERRPTGSHRLRVDARRSPLLAYSKIGSRQCSLHTGLTRYTVLHQPPRQVAKTGVGTWPRRSHEYQRPVSLMTAMP